VAFFPFPLFFDSVIVMASEQLVDFAMGLANSNHSFLWVIRRDLVIGNPAILPAEFEVETKKRGFIANRCLQEEVPSHPPVGGFSAYSGRGSTIYGELICWTSNGLLAILCRPTNELKIHLQRTGSWYGD
jgi:hypothetical protein